MLLLRSETLPEGVGWSVELEAGRRPALWHSKPPAKVQLRSRNKKNFNGGFLAVVKGSGSHAR
jgi:hypothetical protein